MLRVVGLCSLSHALCGKICFQSVTTGAICQLLAKRVVVGIG